MSLTAAQIQTLKADIALNANTIPAGMPWSFTYAGVQVKNAITGNNFDQGQAVAGWYNQLASPEFDVFRSNVSPAEIFDQILWANYTPQAAPDATVQWSNWSLACQGKQVNLQILLQGQAVFNAGRVNLRAGLNDATTALPSGASGASKSGGWTTILPILRRPATFLEKLFAGTTTGVGTVGTDPLGATTNPGLLVVEGAVAFLDVLAAANS